MKIILNQPYSFHHKGQREKQEDSRWPDSDVPIVSQRYFLVCDGVGGGEHGKTASSTICESFGRKMPVLEFSRNFSNDDFSKVLDYSYDQLDKKTRYLNGRIGTTFSFICFHGGGCTMAHIGDTRIYQIRPGENIIYRSEDHSLVNSLVHNGAITPQDAITHPQRNMIIRSMSPLKVNEERCSATVVRSDNIRIGDYFLLCSDGVTEKFSDEQLLSLMSDTTLSDKEKIEYMASKCRNCSDNNTAILINIKSVEEKQEVKYDFSEGDATVPLKHTHQQLSEIKSVPQTKRHGILGKLQSYFRT